MNLSDRFRIPFLSLMLVSSLSYALPSDPHFLTIESVETLNGFWIDGTELVQYEIKNGEIFAISPYRTTPARETTNRRQKLGTLTRTGSTLEIIPTPEAIAHLPPETEIRIVAELHRTGALRMTNNLDGFSSWLIQVEKDYIDFLHWEYQRDGTKSASIVSPFIPQSRVFKDYDSIQVQQATLDRDGKLLLIGTGQRTSAPGLKPSGEPAKTYDLTLSRFRPKKSTFVPDSFIGVSYDLYDRNDQDNKRMYASSDGSVLTQSLRLVQFDSQLNLQPEFGIQGALLDPHQGRVLASVLGRYQNRFFIATQSTHPILTDPPQSRELQTRQELFIYDQYGVSIDRISLTPPASTNAAATSGRPLAMFHHPDATYVLMGNQESHSKITPWITKIPHDPTANPRVEKLPLKGSPNDDQSNERNLHHWNVAMAAEGKIYWLRKNSVNSSLVLDQFDVTGQSLASMTIQAPNFNVSWLKAGRDGKIYLIGFYFGNRDLQILSGHFDPNGVFAIASIPNTEDSSFFLNLFSNINEGPFSIQTDGSLLGLFGARKKNAQPLSDPNYGQAYSWYEDQVAIFQLDAGETTMNRYPLDIPDRYFIRTTN